MLADMDSAELTEWMAYEKISGPLGPERIDVLSSIVAATVANTARGKGQRAKEPADFLPEWDQGAEARARDWEQMLTTVKAMNRRLHGNDLTEGAGHDA
jgi:hypothetical protein